ncbi:MSHA biogenesis protein MshI [Shewanella sp. AS1]|uniref:MSHA biogenesis protein MshI n=1 Tax=Shewanella sp. AS1 TaxID=2907626 RepID=UPI001F3B5D68|nr:MSHA biogenesis protein MshI [Shewanella sp. AS1]MCE9679778.1 MSHA biogenesis protein MshI [Shewanella sp. AS1]
MKRLAFWQKKHKRVDIGVYVTSERLTLSHADESAPLEQISFAGQDWYAALAILAQRLPGAHLQIVLNSAFYQLLVVDKPAVEAAEIPQALVWSIKDMVARPVNTLHFDYFEPPESTQNKLNLVVVEREFLSEMAQAAEKYGLVISTVSIEEMAISNLSVTESLAKLVLLHEPNQELKLIIVKQGQLFMQRTVRGFNQIDKVSGEDLRLGVADSLSLELQRSMDYFESQLRQAPVAEIALLMGGDTGVLAELLAAHFYQKVAIVPCASVGEQLAKLACLESKHQQEAA